jgi:hypothetical protein
MAVCGVSLSNIILLTWPVMLNDSYARIEDWKALFQYLLDSNSVLEKLPVCCYGNHVTNELCSFTYITDKVDLHSQMLSSTTAVKESSTYYLTILM